MKFQLRPILIMYTTFVFIEGYATVVFCGLLRRYIFSKKDCGILNQFQNIIFTIKNEGQVVSM